MQFDLLDRGYTLDRLGTPALSWWDLKCFFLHLPAGSALRKLHDPDKGWDLHAYLLAVAIDLLAGANWQRSGDELAPRPTPFPRPGIDEIVAEAPAPKIPLDEIKLRMQQRRLELAAAG